MADALHLLHAQTYLPEWLAGLPVHHEPEAVSVAAVPIDLA
jgi:hypothetical protein